MTSPDWYPREFILPATDAEHEALRLAQRVLRVEATGKLDPSTMSALRGIQKMMGLVPTGFLDTATANMIDKMRWS